MPESMSTSEERLSEEITKAFTDAVRANIKADISDSLKQAQENIGVMRAILADGVDRDIVWAHTQLDLAGEIGDRFTDLVAQHQGMITEQELRTVAGGFAITFSSLMLAIAESGIDLTDYCTGPAVVATDD